MILQRRQIAVFDHDPIEGIRTSAWSLSVRLYSGNAHHGRAKVIPAEAASTQV